MRKVTLIGVPLDLGAGRRGVDMGPSAFRLANIHERITALRHELEDSGDIAVAVRETRDSGDPRARYLSEITRTCELLRDRVLGVLEAGRTPVVLGGDHSMAMGTISGLSRFHRLREQKIGLVWFDAHGDMNTPETSPSGNVHGMPLAAVLGMGAPCLTNLAGHVPMVDPANVAVVGLRDVDDVERETIRGSGIHAFTMRDIDERGMGAVMEAAIRHASAGTVGIHVSFDVDGMDPDYAPGVGTPAPGGFSYREAHLAMEMLADTGRVLAVELAEVNPILDDGNRTATLCVGLLASLLGKRIL
jgi:arginase